MSFNFMTVEEQLGLKIKEKRLAIRMSQFALAEKMGTEQTYISKIEAGKKKLQVATVVRIALALGTTASTLLDGVALSADDE
ncbi:helix-turn-helix domain-containing protein [Terasakiella pusilla]|uniref:helix-turn-helix domain-containing protein n=1 Tax=Terasakiella pusilla TaxID=64973 RepID=UPI00068DE696|nr:helix-turn-helix transcriptional regulator [Terasakiella pusilla]